MNSSSRRPIDDSFLNQLKDSADIASVIGAKVNLKPSGSGRLVGLCPFHEEKTPSFSVNTQNNFYHCFGCGASGDVCKFIMETEGMDFYDAVHRLADMQGVKVQYREGGGGLAKDEDYKIVKLTMDYYCAELANHPQARDYLNKRGITDGLIQEYRIGYAPPGYDNLLSQLATERDRAVALRLGLVKIRDNQNKPYDALRDRVIFPILDGQRRPIGFGGRIVSEDSKEAKYINSTDSDIFHKQYTVFGLPQALASKINNRLTVVEGYMDVLSLSGLERAVACLGTALSVHHAKSLFARSTTLVLAFDGDEAGRKAAERAMLQCLPVLDDKKELLLKFLPQGKDPSDLLTGTENGERIWRELPELSVEDYLLQPFKLTMDPTTARTAIDRLTAALAKMPANGARRSLIHKEAERNLGIRINVPEPSNHKTTYSINGGSIQKEKDYERGRDASKVPVSLQQKLLIQLLLDPDKSNKLLERWEPDLIEASKLACGKQATELLAVIRSAKHGTAYLYGYALGKEMFFTTGLDKLSYSWRDSADDCISKILINVYKGEMEQAIEKEDKEHRIVTQEKIAQLSRG